MEARNSGGCACGGIRYETDGAPLVMLNCHCRECQRAGGGGYAAIMVVPKAAVRWVGEPRYYRSAGAEGKAVERGFCPNCGSQVVAKLERMPDVLGLQAGSLDEPARYAPAMDIFTASAQPWDCMHAGTKKLTHGLAA